MIRRHPLIGSAGSKYGLAYTDNNAVFLERQTANGAITDSKKLKIKIKELKGKSLVWNQLMQNGDFTDGTSNWQIRSATSSIANGIITLNTPTNGLLMSQQIPGIIGHKYFGVAYVKTTSPQVYFRIGDTSVYHSGSGNFERLAAFYTKDIFNVNPQFRDLRTSNYDDVQIKNVVLIDLTFLGIDNLTTVEEVEAWLAQNVGNLPYYAFNSGTILNNKFNIFESVEFNQWDEEWETGKYVNGAKIGSNFQIRCKNPIPCFSSTVYKETVVGEKSNTTFEIHFLDATGNFISTLRATNDTFKTPGNCHYLVFNTATAYYGATYNHNICINLSNPIHNGQYKPYKSHTINLNLTTLTGKVNGEGESVVICPDGLKSAGTVYDKGVIENGYLTKIVKRVGVVDMGNLRWIKRNTDNKFQTAVLTDIAMDKTVTNIICSKYVTETIPGHTNVTDKEIGELSAGGLTNGQIIVADSTFENSDAADFKAAMSSVLLNYELNTPITYVLDNPIYVGTYGHSYGVERILPQNIEEPYTTPANMVIDYLTKG